jgi:hypothetical protein
VEKIEWRHIFQLKKTSLIRPARHYSN